MVKLTGGKRRQSRSVSKSRKYRGGSGAAEYGQAVYGSAPQQHAVSSTDNTIAMNPVPSMSGGAPLMPAQLGGSANLAFTEYSGGGGKKGGAFDVLIPAALLYANNTFGKKSEAVHAIGNMGRSVGRSVRFLGSKGRKSRRRGSSRRRTKGG